MFAPRRTSPPRRALTRHGAPLLAGLAVGAVLIGAAAVATPSTGTPPALNAALGAPLTTPAGPPSGPAAPPAPTARPRATVPAPAPVPVLTTTTAVPVPTTTPAPTPAAEPATTEPTPPAPAPPTRRAAPATDAQSAVVAATNAEREAAGCDALRVDPRLTEAAQGHAEDMAGNDYFSHTSRDGRAFDDRIRDAGHPSPGGENIAAGQESAEEVVQAWMDSPGHRRNILDCDFAAIGVGHDPRGDHWVQNFGF